jgi:hypothetical protein
MNRTEKRLLTLQVAAENCSSMEERLRILNEIRAMEAILRELSSGNG